MIPLGPLHATEVFSVAQMLARAFCDNPLNLAVIRSRDPQRRRRVNAHGMRALLPVARERGQVLVAREGDVAVGALISTPPFAYPLPPPPTVSRLLCLLGQGWRVSLRWAEAFRVLDEAHPVEPHWYLSTLGVDPDRQGQGTGSKLLRRWLEDADRGGEPAYLETDLERNLPFYASAGFELTGEFSVLGAQIWSMWRAARG